MPKGITISEDLRARVVAAYQSGQTTMQAVAERFAVKRGWVNEIVQRYKRTGNVAPSPRGGGAIAKLGEQHYPVLADIVERQNDATLAEIAVQLAERTGVKVSPATICRTLQKIELSRKKKLSTPTNEIQRQ
ncbi:IS630 transposase-related protein [Pseudanabaena sp. PCC 6802]|uniref:IS630 transposase-related protein n=1 Tax=Pseudanabaena sp. PCC 6802 TaxID=118173 RepID=UPI00036F6E6F|nr:IS630 transposase-related protein [Pseudanabaena sp. PCC 6802]